MSSIIHHQSPIIHRNKGIALLMVLMIVMAITIISAGFIARTDLQLAGSVNTDLRMQMDQLADSALEHGRGLVLHPQDIDLGESTGWTWSAAGQQLAEGSPDSYDVAVSRDGSNPSDYCTYDILCEAYRQADVAGETTKTARAALAAKLRLDPCIALWTGAAATLRSSLTVVGDVQCGGAFTNYGTIDGDIFANSLPVAGSKTGQFNPQALSLGWPVVDVDVFTSKYSSEDIPPGVLASAVYGPCDPVRVFRCSGDLVLDADVHVDGTLIVEGHLEIRGNGNVIRAGKNVPALCVTGDLTIGRVGDLRIEGLVLVGNNVRISAAASGVEIVGGLFAGNTVVEIATDVSGNGHHGVIRGNPQWEAGPIGAALRLGSIADYVDCGTDPAFDLVDQVTLTAWVNTQDTGNGQHNPYVAKGDHTYAIKHNSANQIEFFVYDGANGVWRAARWAAPGNFNGIWHHVAGTYDREHVRLYVDGTLQDEQGYTGPISVRAQHPVFIGRDFEYRNRDYRGDIDDVRIYGRALLGEEILDVMGGHPVPLGLVARWTLEGPGQVTVVAEPIRAAIVTWPQGAENPAQYWSPAAGAFFRSIERPSP